MAGAAFGRSKSSILLVDCFFGTPRWEQTVGEGLELGAALIQQLQAVASPDEFSQSIKQFDNGESLVRCPISRNGKGDSQERASRSRSLHGGSPCCLPGDRRTSWRGLSGASPVGLAVGGKVIAVGRFDETTDRNLSIETVVDRGTAGAAQRSQLGERQRLIDPGQRGDDALVQRSTARVG